MLAGAAGDIYTVRVSVSKVPNTIVNLTLSNSVYVRFVLFFAGTKFRKFTDSTLISSVHVARCEYHIILSPWFPYLPPQIYEYVITVDQEVRSPLSMRGQVDKL